MRLRIHETKYQWYSYCASINDFTYVRVWNSFQF
jgi:hypothetical protein